jgi:hypothetical protein
MINNYSLIYKLYKYKMAEIFIKTLNETSKLIEEYLGIAKDALNLININIVGKISDNLNKINMLQKDLEKNSLINQINIFKEIKNIIKECVELLKSENIINNTLVGRSFTFISDVKKLRDGIIKSPEIFDKSFSQLMEDYSKIIPINTEEDRELIRKNPELLILMIGRLNDKKSQQIINKKMDEILQIDTELTDVASIVLRTWPRTSVIVNQKPTVMISTGQNIKYNLQGYVSASWVAKNKLGSSPTSGLSKLDIERCATITRGNETPVDFYIKEQTTSDLTISYGLETFKLDYMPEIPKKIISYGILLASDVAKNIILTPADDEKIPNKDESFRNDMLMRVKSNANAGLKEFLRTLDKSAYKSLLDLLKALVRICAASIKDSLITSSKDINKLLINMAVITDGIKRINIELSNIINNRFENISINTLMEKNDFNEIIQNSVMKSLDELNRQPSIFDQLF